MRALLAEDFVRSALLAAAATAVVCGVIGVLVVLRGLSFAVHALAELGLTGAAAALLLGVAPALGLLVGAVVTGSLLGSSSARERRPDAAVGVLLSLGLGVGVLLLSVQRGYVSAATSLLLGDVLAVGRGPLLLLVAMAALVLVVLAALWRPLLFATLDPAAAAGRGVPVRAMSVVLLVLTGITAAQAVQVVGVLLVLSLVVTPAAAAVRIAGRPATAVALSVSFALIAAVGGVLLALALSVPVSSCVAGLSFACYAVARWGRLPWRRSRPSTPAPASATVPAEISVG